MPNYDFKCPVCETVEERNVSVQDRSDQECYCGNRLERVWNFKGSVWAPTATGGGHK